MTWLERVREGWTPFIARRCEFCRHFRELPQPSATNGSCFRWPPLVSLRESTSGQVQIQQVIGSELRPAGVGTQTKFQHQFTRTVTERGWWCGEFRRAWWRLLKEGK